MLGQQPVHFHITRCCGREWCHLHVELQCTTPDSHSRPAIEQLIIPPNYGSWRHRMGSEFSPTLRFASGLSPGDRGIAVRPMLLMDPGKSVPLVFQGPGKQKHLKCKRPAAIVSTATDVSALVGVTFPFKRMFVDSVTSKNNGQSIVSGPLWVTRTLKSITARLQTNVFSLYGLPEAIISDQSPRFAFLLRSEFSNTRELIVV